MSKTAFISHPDTLLHVMDGNHPESPARITVLHNGVLVQNNTTILGLTNYIGLHMYTAAHGEDVIHLQDHNNKTQFKNIWIRRL